MTIDIEQYFSRKEDDGGVWFEPDVNGKKIGVEFFIHGPNSDKAMVSNDYYQKMRDLATRIKDDNEREHFLQLALADRYASCISDMRSTNGSEIKLNNKPATIKDVKEILYKAPQILNSIDLYYRTYTKSFVVEEEELEKAVRNYFYLNQQYAEKTTTINTKTKQKETKTKYVRNIDRREDFIRKFKQKAFDKICEEDESWAKLKTIPIPNGYIWLFNHFLEIWYMCDVDFGGNRIFQTKDILNYCKCFGVNISYYERYLLVKMKGWAMSEISQLDKKSNENL